ncbi:MAG: molecular chaperone DnaJ [Candidatus Bruticola sp.]
MATSIDYYEVLNVSRNASDQEIKQAYRRLVRKYHPDVAEDKEKAQEEMIKVNEAYGILSDPDKRAYYDNYGEAPGSSSARGGGGFSGFGGFGGFGGLGDIFESFMNMGGGRDDRQPRRGRDIRLGVKISLQEAYTGCKRDIEFTVHETCLSCRGKRTTEPDGIEECPTCHGAGRVQKQINIGFGTVAQVVECPTCGGLGKKVKKPCSECKGTGLVENKKHVEIDIPAGIDTGNGLRVPECGEPGINGGPRGNVVVMVEVEDDPRFIREGSDLIYKKDITFTEAALGDNVDIEQVVGKSEKLAIPPGTQSGSTFRIRGRGMPEFGGSHFGDLHVVVQVIVPTKLNDKQKKLLQEFAQAGPQEAKEPSKGFFRRIHDAIFG